jgi:hypothetical protein
MRPRRPNRPLRRTLARAIKQHYPPILPCLMIVACAVIVAAAAAPEQQEGCPGYLALRAGQGLDNDGGKKTSCVAREFPRDAGILRRPMPWYAQQRCAVLF